MKETDEMIPIGDVAKQTGVSRYTLRWWAQTGRIPAERRENERGVMTWHMSIEAVQGELKHPKSGGRPIKIRG